MGAETRLSYVLHTIDIPIGAIEIYNERKVFCTEKVGTLLGFVILQKWNTRLKLSWKKYSFLIKKSSLAKNR